jgi:hypothetical protein
MMLNVSVPVVGEVLARATQTFSLSSKILARFGEQG